MKRWLPLLLCLVLAPQAVASAAMNAQREILPNGMVLVTSEQPALPIVSVQLLIRAGSRHDPAERHGVANLTSRLLIRGTPTRDSMAISGLVEGMGAHLGTDAGRELATVSLSILKKDLDTGLALMSEVLTEPSFPEKELDRTKQSLLASIRAKRDRPGSIAREAFRAALYPGSFYGRPVEGSRDSVRGLDRNAVVDFHRRYYRPDRAIFVAVGDVTHEEMKRKLGEVLAGWAKSDGAPDGPVTLRPPERTAVKINRNLTRGPAPVEPRPLRHPSDEPDPGGRQPVLAARGQHPERTRPGVRRLQLLPRHQGNRAFPDGHADPQRKCP